ncbi:MAG: hypothetical protein WA581_19955 [Candidatus Acidiferrales bacterium]
MRTMLFLPALVVMVVLCAPPLAAGRQTEIVDSGVITCRVIEAHGGTHPAVVALMFHQAEKADQPLLGSLLRERFGRGLLLLPGDAPPLKGGATFILKFSQAVDKN